MMTQNLNGEWNYRIGKGAVRKIQVPFSALPVGHSECFRSFDLDRNFREASDKIYLKFDGITYAAKVYFNDTLLGNMLPYVEYSFDITEYAKKTDNQLSVELEDIAPIFGPTAGWENFGGIIRDVSILYKNKNHIEDVFAHSVLEDAYTAADFVVETKCTEAEGAEFEISLSYGGRTVLSYSQSASEAFRHQKVTDLQLWSPETPNLYQLEVTLRADGKVLDTYTCNVGFRDISCDRHRFLINGKPVFLKGVCKHEMFGDSGHCPTEAQMEEDMRLIKETGCNFVRLVHYPHNKKILDIADKIGLFVSEEPGLWWSDTADPEVSSGSLEVLKRTILRDRNHPSIAFWLSFNECRFTEQFLIDSVNVCRKYDPTRMVSGANCMSDEDTKKYYNICNFDFYTMHPYAPTFDRAQKSVEYLNDKPLLFTEWGGYFVYNNPNLLTDFIGQMSELYQANSDEGALAGAFFWCWAEVNDFNRGKPACIDGNLHEGLVTVNRKPTMIYEAFCEALDKIGIAEKEEEFWLEPESEMNFGTCNLLQEVMPQQPEKSFAEVMPQQLENGFAEVMAEVAKEERTKPSMRYRILKKGPVLQGIIPLTDVPICISDHTQEHFKCDCSAKELKLVGLVSLTKGYPLSGEYGEEVATMQIFFGDGRSHEYILRNGIEVTTVFGLHNSSRINPVAEKAKREAVFGYEKNFERYVLNSMKLTSDNDSGIKAISIKSANNGYALLLYGITY